MSRGKYAARSAIRRDAEATATDLATYQAAVVRLTGEVKDLKARLSRSEDAHRADVRVLKAQLSEGLSPELRARDGEINRLRDERDEARRDLKAVRERIQRLVKGAKAALMAEGWKNMEAFEFLCGLAAGGDNFRVVDPPNTRRHRGSGKRHAALQRAALAADIARGVERSAVRPQDDPDFIAQIKAALAEDVEESA